jgi:hypothetical protein
LTSSHPVVPHPQVFERQKNQVKDLTNVSLSVFYTPSGKATQMTLDVVAKHPDVLRTWCLGIEMLIAELGSGGFSSSSSSGLEGGGAGGGGGGDDDEDDDGAYDQTHSITGSCKVFSWGTGGWGQLGRPRAKTSGGSGGGDGDGGSGGGGGGGSAMTEGAAAAAEAAAFEAARSGANDDEAPTVRSDGRVAPMIRPPTKKGVRHDVRAVACGGHAT